MAYVQKSRADIVYQRTKQFGNFVGSLFDTAVQSGAQEIMQIQAREDQMLVDDTVSKAMLDVKGKYQEIKTAGASYDQWAIEYAKLYDAKSAELDSMDVSKSVKQSIMQRFQQLGNDYAFSVQEDMVNSHIAKLAAYAEEKSKSLMETNSPDQWGKMNGFVFVSESANTPNVMRDMAGKALGGDRMNVGVKKPGEMTFIGDKVKDSSMSFSIEEEQPDDGFKRIVVPDGATDYDKKVAGLNYIAEQTYGKNITARNMFVQSNIPALRAEQAKQDTDILFEGKFTGNPDTWDYNGGFEDFASTLEGMEYGGVPLTVAERNAMKARFKSNWDEKIGQTKEQAKSFYTKNVQASLQSILDKGAINSEIRLLPTDVDQAFEKMEATFGKSFTNEYKYSWKQVAMNNDDIIAKRRFGELHTKLKSKSGLTDAEREEYATFDVRFDDADLVEAASAYIQVQNSLAGLSINTKIGYSDVVDPEKYAELYNKVSGREIKTYTDWNTALGEYRQYLTPADAREIESEFSRQLGISEKLSSDQFDVITKGANKLMAEGNFNVESWNAFMQDKKYDQGRYGKEVAYYNELAKDNSAQSLNGELTEKKLNGNLTREDITTALANFPAKEYPALHEKWFGEIEKIELDDFNVKIDNIILTGTAEQLEAAIKDSPLDKEKYAVLIAEKREGMANATYKTALGQYSEALANKSLTPAMVREFTKTLDKKKFGQSIAQMEEVARENVIDLAGQDMAALGSGGAITDESYQEVAKKYGIDAKTDPVTYNKFMDVVNNQKIDSATKLFNTLNMKDNISDTQVEKIIKDFGLNENEHPELIKAMKQKAQDIFDAHLKTQQEADQNIERGYASETTKDAKDAMNLVLKGIQEGTTTKKAALDALYSNKGGFTETDYRAMFNDISAESMMQTERANETFNEIYNSSFASETIMPGDTLKAMEAAGLKADDWVNAPYADRVSQLMTQEKVNQHNAYAPAYMEASQYLAARNYNISDEDLESVGIKLPDNSQYWTIEYLAEHDGVGLSREEAAKKIIEETSGKLMQEGKASIDKGVADSVDAVYNSLKAGIVHGAKRDDLGSLRQLQFAKFTKSDVEFDEMAYRMYVGGLITEDTYTKTTAEDLTKYQSPLEQSIEKAQKDALDGFMKYAEAELKGFKYKVGTKEVGLSLFQIDSTAQNWGAVFLERYKELAANYGPPTAEQVSNLNKQLYDDMMNEKYFNDAEAFSKFMKGDSSNMYKVTMTGTTATDNLNVLKHLQSYGTPLFDQQAFSSLMKDPDDPTDSFGNNSGLFAYISSMRDSGDSNEAIGNTIIHRVIKHMGYGEGLLDPTDAEFTDNVKTIMGGMPNMARVQVEQMAAIVKLTFDAYNQAIEDIGEENIKTLNPDGGNIVPVWVNNRPGIDIAGHVYEFNVNEDSKTVSYLYDDNGSLGTLSVSDPALEKAEKRFTDKFMPSLQWFTSAMSIDLGSLVTEVNKPEIKGNKEALSETLMISFDEYERSAHFMKISGDYLEILNKSIRERNRLTGSNNPEYIKIDLTLDEEKFNSLMKSPNPLYVGPDAISSVDIRKLIKWTPLVGLGQIDGTTNRARSYGRPSEMSIR